jgi:cell volume regulation protein A
MVAGSEGPGGIHFDDPYLAQFLGVVALSFILFAGGLETNWKSVRPLLRKGAALSTIGVLATALLVGWFSAALLGFTLYEGLLLGAIISSTDAAAVFSVLRSQKVSLSGNLKPLLELESGSNDPMAVMLTTGFIGLLLNPGDSILGMIPMIIRQMALGAAVGYVMGKGMVLLLNNIRLEYSGLYPVLSLSLVMLTYGTTAAIGGNGFLAVYISGLIMGNQNFIHKTSLKRFHDGLAWLMQISMFLTLGLLVFPSQLLYVIETGLLVAIFLMFVARPAGVFLALVRSGMNFREKTMVSWVGLRGAVPIILATFPLLAGVPRADLIFNIVFFIVLTSALLQGTTIPVVARWLRVDAPLTEKARYPLECEPTESMTCNLVEIEIPDDSIVIGKQLVDLGFPEGVLIVLVNRAGEMFIPGGNTVVTRGDKLLVLSDEIILQVVRGILEKKEVKPSRQKHE